MSEYRKKLLNDIGVDFSELDITIQNWKLISKNKILSEEFIREFQDFVDWMYVTAFQTLSEEFIREFQEKVSWTYVSSRQFLTDEFLVEFKHKIQLDTYFGSQKSSMFILMKFIIKSSYEHIPPLSLKSLDAQQQQEIQRLLDIKNLFSTT